MDHSCHRPLQYRPSHLLLSAGRTTVLTEEGRRGGCPDAPTLRHRESLNENSHQCLARLVKLVSIPAIEDDYPHTTLHSPSVAAHLYADPVGQQTWPVGHEVAPDPFAQQTAPVPSTKPPAPQHVPPAGAQVEVVTADPAGQQEPPFMIWQSPWARCEATAALPTVMVCPL